jgi:hypothetical protein
MGKLNSTCTAPHLEAFGSAETTPVDAYVDTLHGVAEQVEFESKFCKTSFSHFRLGGLKRGALKLWVS